MAIRAISKGNFGVNFYKFVNMTIGEAHKVWARKMKGSQVTQEEILEARKAFEEKIEEWNKLDDIAREIIGDQEMLKLFNDNPKVKEAADRIIPQYKKARELVKDFIGMYEKELGDL